MRGGHNRKIDENQRHQLLQVYLHMGMEESRRLGVEYGVCANYASKHASHLGLSNKKPPSLANARRLFWTEQKRGQLRGLAASGKNAAEIGVALETSQASVITFCGINKVDVIKNTPEQQAAFDARLKAREAERHARKVAANSKAKVDRRRSDMSRGDFTALAVKSATSKTSKAYRLALPPIGEMTKAQLRAMLSEAVENTAAMQSAEASA
jgi:hypothetical protein